MERINPVALSVLQQYVPLPNLRGDGHGNGMSWGHVQQLSRHARAGAAERSGQRFGSTTAGRTAASLFGRYTLSNERGFTPENLPGFGTNHDNRLQNVTASFVQPIGSRLVHEVRVGFARMQLARDGESRRRGTISSASWASRASGFGGADAYGLPLFNVQGYQPFGDSLLCTPCQLRQQAAADWRPTDLGQGPALAEVRRRLPLLQVGHARASSRTAGYYQFTNGFTTETASNDGTGQALASFLLGLPTVMQRQAGLPSMNMRQPAIRDVRPGRLANWHSSDAQSRASLRIHVAAARRRTRS